MNTSLPNIFQYNNFRRFLADYQQARQATDKHFTKSYICRSLGLPHTRSYFNDVIAGKEVTKTFVERFVQLLGFDKSEAQFFRILIAFNQAGNADEREFYFGQLISLNRTPTRVVDTRLYLYYKEWYHGAVRALLEIFDFKDDYSALSKKLFPQISAKQARDSIVLLSELGLIAPNENGFLKPTEKSITTGAAGNNELIKQYQLQAIELAKSVLLQNCRQPHTVTTNVLSISQQGFERLQKQLKKFRAETRSLVHKDEQPADRVYYLNIQLFPISR